MIKFSANLGFLWNDMEITDAIHKAAACGFEAVECHWPYDVSSEKIAAVLQETGLPMLGLNTRPGNREAGDFGLSAVTGRAEEAQLLIDEAIEYAAAIGASNVHVMAGISHGAPEAESTYRENLQYACQQAQKHNITILIEPINHRDAPGYHLYTVEAAVVCIKELAFPNLKLMFDCYHTQIMQGDLLTRMVAHMPFIGHIQIAAVPDRGEPDKGEVNYVEILKALDQKGYTGYVGAEYLPRTTTDNGLGWLEQIKQRIS